MEEKPLERHDLICYGCGATPPPASSLACPVCGDPLSLRARCTPPQALFAEARAPMWHYFDLLPVSRLEHVVSLGEGGTPLIEAPRLAARIGAEHLCIKNETANPTGSFKDRQVSVGISHAIEIGADTVTVVSSGNVACAASAYAARAGLRAVLLMHGQAAPDKVAMAGAYGGRAIQVDSPSAAAVFDLCLEACSTFGWYHLSTAGIYNPFNVEGAKTIAYELYAALGRDLPDWIVAPVGGGGLLGGIWRGFTDLERARLIDRVPRLAGVQARGCAPLKLALDEGWSFQESLAHPWPNPKTVAGGIADDVLFDGHTVLAAIRQTNGVAIVVDDFAILEAQRRLAESEGILCEPTSAVVIAALDELVLDPGARVCAVVTGTGFKDISALRAGMTPPTRIGLSLDALAKRVRA